MSNPESVPSIVVGVTPGQSDAVARAATRLAKLIGARLEFVQVDLDRYPVQDRFATADLLVEAVMPIDPDPADAQPREFDAELEAHLRRLVDEVVPWRTHRLAGDPADALSRLADRVDAEMIVVGTREATVRAGIREFFTGSVAVHLSHRQHRPVVVVPLAPVSKPDDLPWA